MEALFTTRKSSVSRLPQDTDKGCVMWTDVCRLRARRMSDHKAEGGGGSLGLSIGCLALPFGGLAGTLRHPSTNKRELRDKECT